MPVTADAPAPYAPASALIDIIGRYRSRGLPIPVTGEVLGRAGVSESLIPRTIQALKTLDLIDDDGKPTQVLEGLRLAPEGDYKQRFAQWLNEAYADVLNYVDPGTASETQLRDAFRNYQPVGQQPRMMSLFAGLYREAGIGSDDPKPKRGSVSRPKPASFQGRSLFGASKKPSMPAQKVPAPQPEQEFQPVEAGQTRQMEGNEALISQLVGKFPTFDPAWSDELKAKWFDGFQTFMGMAKKP